MTPTAGRSQSLLPPGYGLGTVPAVGTAAKLQPKASEGTGASGAGAHWAVHQHTWLLPYCTVHSSPKCPELSAGVTSMETALQVAVLVVNFSG